MAPLVKKISFESDANLIFAASASPDNGDTANLCRHFLFGLLSFLLSFVTRAIGRRQRGLPGFSAKEKARSGGVGLAAKGTDMERN